jgi:hypothetical protein
MATYYIIISAQSEKSRENWFWGQVPGFFGVLVGTEY